MRRSPDRGRERRTDALRVCGWLLIALCCCAGQQGDGIRLGMDAFNRKDFARAETLFRSALADHPRSALAHKLLGMSLAARDDYRQALEPFRRACELDPFEESACYYLGRTLFSLSRFEDALKAFDVALRTGHGRGRILLGTAQTLEALGRTADAERHYKEAVAAGEQRALVDYGLFLHRNGRGPESLDVLQRAGSSEQLARIRRSVEGIRVGAAAAGTEPVKFKSIPLDMTVLNGAAGRKHLVETMPAGVAVLDFNNDGREDVFVSNGAEFPSLEKPSPAFWNRLFRNEGAGKFADVTSRAGLEGKGYCMGVAAADFDNDGWTDLFVTGVRGNKLYRNQGNGTFQDITPGAGVAGNGSWSVAAGWFDYDSDGRLDLFVVNYVQWDPGREIYCGVSQEGHRSYCHPRYYGTLPNTLYHNLGGGKFEDVSKASGIGAYQGKGMGVAFADYDHDGHIDVFVANDTVANFLFRNRGDGTFEEVALKAGVAYNNYGSAISSMGGDFRDFDNDGWEDLFVTALTNEMFPLFRNQGDGSFADVSGPVRIAAASMPWSGWGNGCFDFNNDGRKDFFSANGHAVDNIDLISNRSARQPNVVFLNRSDSTFQSVELPGAALHRGAAFGDFDGDGRIDAVVTRLNEPPAVLMNVSPTTGNWIRFRLQGTRSNRDGVGAMIEIETEKGRQWNRITTSVGYAGSSEPIAHFGLGACNRVAKATIHWPSGAVQIVTDPEAGKLHLVVEP
jgi:enediyne biosynthesis protein E4